MTKEFAPYELAVKLKALGFNEPCFGFYLEDGTWTPASYSRKGTVFPSNADLLPEWCAAPLCQQAFRWFREKYEIYYIIEGSKKFGFQHFIYDDKGSYEIKSEETFKNYEEAELACLIKLIELVESMV